MRKLLLVLFSFFIINIASAHSGRTDSSGGHNDYKNGTYHYHNSGNSGNTSTYSSNLFVCPNPPGYKDLGTWGYCVGNIATRAKCEERSRDPHWCLEKARGKPKSVIGKAVSWFFGPK